MLAVGAVALVDTETVRWWYLLSALRLRGVGGGGGRELGDGSGGTGGIGVSVKICADEVFRTEGRKEVGGIGGCGGVGLLKRSGVFVGDCVFCFILCFNSESATPADCGEAVETLSFLGTGGGGRSLAPFTLLYC